MERSATSEWAPTGADLPPPREPVSTPARPRTFLGVMRHFPTAVSVLTTVAGAAPVGMTAGSVTSLSLDPELLMVCVRQGSRFGTAIADSGGFVVNVLGQRQAGVARWFASPDRFGAADEFAGIGWSPAPASGHPLLADAAGVLECRTTQLLPIGDHVIAIGQVIACEARPSVRPLLRYTGRYHAIGSTLADR